MLWIKAWHIIAVICWFCGLLYLPRLFVYHAESADQLSHERFLVMEKRLFSYIMTPAAIIGIILGLWLLTLNPFFMKMGWLHAKLALVLLLILFHGFCGYQIKQFAQGKAPHSAKFYRFVNELPSLALIAIVILVVVKPF